MSPIEDINRMVVDAAKSLEMSLHKYWPVVNPNNNGLQEANLTIHLASQAMNHGFFAYPEASNADTCHGHSRLDLLLISPKVAVLVEAKKLYSAEKAGEMVDDFGKIKRFSFLDDDKKGFMLATIPKYGLFLAITDDKKKMEWWNEPYDWVSGSSWDKLKTVLETAVLRTSIELSAKRPQYVLYAVFEI
ncbi:hypothetical protein [Oceanisphaera sp. W20_SRM_FM3]|uniref:hypothetical protein n=1 Tax=Oceanisphaera sp. W20_SRM_FM3 TaxID=3240267 RepID=UPI003F991CD0